MYIYIFLYLSIASFICLFMYISTLDVYMYNRSSKPLQSTMTSILDFLQRSCQALQEQRAPRTWSATYHHLDLQRTTLVGECRSYTSHTILPCLFAYVIHNLHIWSYLHGGIGWSHLKMGQDFKKSAECGNLTRRCTPLQSVSDIYPLCSSCRQSVFSQVLPAALRSWSHTRSACVLPVRTRHYRPQKENPPGSEELQLQVQSLGFQPCQAVRGSDEDPFADVNSFRRVRHPVEHKIRRVWILPGHRPAPVKIERCWTKPLFCHIPWPGCTPGIPPRAWTSH